MGYYIRVLATDDTQPSEQELRERLRSTPASELVVESKDETGWRLLILRHLEGPEIAVIERNPVLPGQLGEEEIAEFIEGVRDGKPTSAARWLEDYFSRVKVIYAFQLLKGTDIRNGWAAVHGLRNCIWAKGGGILQSDGEGFSNEDGYHILWQFADTVEGEWNMAVLDENGSWNRFRMDLGSADQRADFLEGRIPKTARAL